MIPTLTHQVDIVFDTPSGSVYGVSFDFDISPDFRSVFSNILSDILFGLYSDIVCGIYFAILSGSLSGPERRDLEPRVCGQSPAEITLIRGLLFGSGEDHCDQELAVEVRREPLRSRAWS